MAVEQLGTQRLIGFDGKTVTGYQTDTVDLEIIGDIDEVRNGDNETATKFISNKGKRFSTTLIVNSGTDPDTVQKGDTITIDGANYMVEEWRVSYVRLAARVSATLVKEDSMTYS